MTVHARNKYLEVDYLKLLFEEIIFLSEEDDPELLNVPFAPSKKFTGWSLEMQQKHWAFPLLTENLADLLELEGQNYLSVKMVATRRETPFEFEVLLQKTNGLTPAENNIRLEEENRTLREQIHQLIQKLGAPEQPEATPEDQRTNVHNL